ncbi:protein kintoun [Chaetodon trifascialis]|uniref:protein kintoun n=1 Tax=Chaetodon trifascialis TaxID=109706 RepID=UPI003994317E
MEVGDKLKELNMTVEEMDRLTKAFKEEKFREMLLDYAQELSDPENQRRYEEEIKLLEQERGNTIEFIHPEPFRALRTSVNGKQKCFVNICGNEKVGKPASSSGVSEEGRRGQCWSLPHSLHPGRQDTDPKGNKIMIYDVIFHPDTLHIASKNKGFMDMVDSTAIQGIQKAFNVTLDKNNVREMSTKYKGTPQPCVIRKSIPGYKVKDPPEKPGPLTFPYPDDKRPTTSSQTKPAESPAANSSSDAGQKGFQIQLRKTKEPTEPNYTVKYRSFIDLQDFRCSRDSAQSPRPKEIVVTIDVPLLKAVKDVSLEVKERRLLLESEMPAYRLELLLAYPVDEDKGEAKFNKQKGQLTVTLPVLPPSDALNFTVGPERQEEKSEVEEEEEEEEERGVEEEMEAKKERETTEEEDLKQQPRAEKDEEEEERGQEKGEKMKEGENSEEEVGGVMEEAKWKNQIGKGGESVEEENKMEVRKLNLEKRQQHEDTVISTQNKLREDGCDGAAGNRDAGGASFQCDSVDQCMDVSQEENSSVAAAEREKQLVSITAEHPCCIAKEGEVNLSSCLASTPKMKTSDIKGETEKTKDTHGGNLQVDTDAEFLHHRSSMPADTQTQSDIKVCCISQDAEESSNMPETGEANESSRGGSGSRVGLCSEEQATGSAEEEEGDNTDEDDLPTEQVFQTPEHDDVKPPPVFLREIDKDGNEKLISDHSTSAGFIFQNSLMYELD